MDAKQIFTRVLNNSEFNSEFPLYKNSLKIWHIFKYSVGLSQFFFSFTSETV